MRAMILAAGRGQRMRPLTSHTPKPLLQVQGQYLIEYGLYALKTAGILEVVINVSYHAEQIKTALGDGKRYNMAIIYSEEPTPLETGGGIKQALPLLGPLPFVVISGDIITDFPIQSLALAPQHLAHLIMVNNPPYHPQGDFTLQKGYLANRVKNASTRDTLTFANIGIYDPHLFSAYHQQIFSLAHVLVPAIDQTKVTGQRYSGQWYNVGFPHELGLLNIGQHIKK